MRHSFSVLTQLTFLFAFFFHNNKCLAGYLLLAYIESYDFMAHVRDS